MFRMTGTYKIKYLNVNFVRNTPFIRMLTR